MGALPVAKSPLARRCAALAVSVLTAAGLITASGVAGAQPQPTISQVEAKLKKLTIKENVLIQRYDQVNEELKSARQRLALIGHEVARDRAAMESMREQIAQIASQVYMNGSMTSAAALLTSNDPQTLLRQSSILIHLSTDNHTQLEQFIATNRQLLGAQQLAKRTTQAIAGLRNKLAKQKATLEKVIEQQKSLLNSLNEQQRQRQLGGGGNPGPGGGGGGGGGGHVPHGGGTQGERAVAFARAQIGCPYVFGGTGPCNRGFDCSGMVQAAWAYAGVSIPRTSEEQAGLPHVPSGDLQPGDILEFAGNSHVALYIGGGMLIDAPTPGMNVEEVSLRSSWYASNYDGAVRP